jgi:hypothetical protein
MEPLKNRRTLFAALGVSLALLAGAILTGLLLNEDGSVAAFSTAEDTAYFSAKVVEGYSETPLSGAQVVVVETGKTYKTDASGLTEVIPVPAVRDTRYDGVLPKPWAEVSLIVYKDGYIPYALFYLQVMAGQTREAVKILMFEEGSSGSSEPFSIIEGPNRAWVDELVEKYRPAD